MSGMGRKGEHGYFRDDACINDIVFSIHCCEWTLYKLGLAWDGI